ncbi:hypothetical protein GGS23DRAFT_621238 [Durotheca rogersii]|uniref:uncharacterized protein n=1 Tax=Durotheca rogersii TaxID=419775 RepID=UPI002221049E|nr:uncharacterized protein GGS23DRAFT_621238 [Durotheca rogersii]KAI5863566.1 hypothetical protein GGS23DRAFT_621238 [Durotheca rogersii]
MSRTQRPGSWRYSSDWRTPDPAASTKRSTFDDEVPEPRPSKKPDISHSLSYDGEKTSVSLQPYDEASAKLIAEGRLAYIGNLHYIATFDDIEELVGMGGPGAPEQIHVSFHPFTRRNPGYCYVEYSDRESATRAISTLNGRRVLGRSIECLPCRPSEDRTD